MEGDTSRGTPGAAVEPNVRMLTELLAERCDVAAGRGRLELEFQDGELLHLWTHVKVPGTAVDTRFRVRDESG